MYTLCFASLDDAKIGTIYTNLPGPFPVRTIQNMQYIFVWYWYWSIEILVRPMKTRSDAYMVESYQDIYEYIIAQGFNPTLTVTDNEFYKAVQNYIKYQNVDWQLVEPVTHRVDAAEKSIQTLKNDFIVELSTIYLTFPL